MDPLVLVLALTLLGADVSEDVEAAQRARLEQLRANVASELQLQAYDLLDELVYQWSREPPVGTETSVVLASVGVPVGAGPGLRALLENHISDLVIRNPECQLRLVHCPACTAPVVHAGKEQTVIGRGVDFPETLERLGQSSGSKHALFLDITAEGSDLVLRARLTRIEPDLPIVASRSLSSSIASASLLRAGDALKSAEEARQEYLDILQEQPRFRFPLRLVVRRYATPDSQQIASTPPSVWLQAGVEFDVSASRQWVAGINAGLTRQPEDDSTGWLVQARIARLLTGQTRSLTSPDIYFFTGLSSINLRGTSATAFRDQVPSLTDLVGDLQMDTPNVSFFSLIAGLEFRVQNRVGLATFVEASPGLRNAPLIGDYINIGLEIQTIGAEVTFWF